MPNFSLHTRARQPLERFRKQFADVEGFLDPRAEIVWDFLLSSQRTMGIAGPMMEIGVWKGRSALLSAMYLAPDEEIVLVDIHPLEAIGRQIDELGGGRAVCITAKSSNLASVDLTRFNGGMRWIHIDGDHSGYSVANDLSLADRFLADHGIVVLDDFFNPRYPQIAAEVYRFLFASPQYKMLLCGINKCYLVRSENYDVYEGLIRKYLSDAFEGQGEVITLSRSTYAHDMGCWSIEMRKSQRLIMGRDQDPANIPY
jgi:Methyltransferase domain